MEEDKNNITFNIYGGNNQILPNATEAKQNIYIGDSAIKIALEKSEGAVDNDIAEKDQTSGTPSESVKIEKDNIQWLLKRAEQIVPAVWNDFSDCGKIIIVVSGDIANTGTEEEYGYAPLAIL